MTKEIEKGVALYYFNCPFPGRRQCVDSINGSHTKTGVWTSSEEVAKVIAAEVALGLEFHEKEDLVAEEIARKKKEDEVRFREV